MLTRAWLISLLTLCGCGAQFSPETLIDSLRILAIEADPPEVAPGERSGLRVLQTDPTRLGDVTTVIWVGCEPDPEDLGRSACNDASILLKPSLITEYPPGLQLLGFGPLASYRSTPTVFDVLAANDPIRQNGSVGQVLAIAVAEDVPVTATGDELKAIFQRIENKETATVVALTRVLVSEKSAKNHNPVITGLTFDGVALPRNARLQVQAGQKVGLSVSVPASSREAYDELLPSGPAPRVETVVGAWYSSNGRFSAERFEVSNPAPTTFTAPGSAQFPEDPVPERRFGSIYLVVRDNRGGEAFETFRFFVCDPSLAAPTVRNVQPAAGAGDTVVVTGDEMSKVLDVVIGDVALERAAYSPGSNSFRGELPQGLAPGSYPISVRGQNCSAADTGLVYVVPQ